MDVNLFLDGLQRLGAERFYGVPDSQLSAFCDLLYTKYGVGKEHIVAANEGGAVGLAAGHYLATGRPAVVYMQNSGIGNAVNPVASLLHDAVYDIPCIFVIGWRGEPGIKDEPQHVFQGMATLPMLDLLEIRYYVLGPETNTNDLDALITTAKAYIHEGKSIAFVIRKGTLKLQEQVAYPSMNTLSREEAIRVIVQNSGDTDIFVCTTGKASRELFEIRESLKQGHKRDFLTVGSMGHASMIALGIAMEKPERLVWCIDGDGAMVMQLGNALIAARQKCSNLIHIVLNNGAHETVGGMPVARGTTDFGIIAKALGYKRCQYAEDERGLIRCIEEAKANQVCTFIEVKVALGARANLGRPTTSPKENKTELMDYIAKAERI